MKGPGSDSFKSPTEHSWSEASVHTEKTLTVEGELNEVVTKARRRKGPLPSAASKRKLRETVVKAKATPSNGRLIVDAHERKSKMKTPKSSEGPTKLGFAGNLPASFTKEVPIAAVFKRHSKFGVIVSKSLLVVKIDDDSFLQGHLKLCDFIVKIDNQRIMSKAEFYVHMRNMRRSEEEFILTVRRPRWNEPAEYLPEGYDRVPGYSYITALLLQYPGAALGMNIKSYNSKVYITHTDQLSISVQSCLMGDCIVDVQGTPVTTVASCNALIISYLSVKKYAVMTLERPIDEQAVRVVRCALLAEKKPEINARMAADTTEIGLREAEKIRCRRNERKQRSIYRKQPKKPNERRHVKMAELSIFTPITCDPYNPILMKAVPPKKMDMFYANKGKVESAASNKQKGSNANAQ
uniref:PDZ domain-containing protein n=2 Tax=Parascaris univalens TaxID=6257 RepID=A0A915BEX7_PARUN